MTVKVEPLSVEAFEPFGDVVSAGLRAGLSANQGTATRFDWCTELVNARVQAKANVSVFRSVANRMADTCYQNEAKVLLAAQKSDEKTQLATRREAFRRAFGCAWRTRSGHSA